MENAFKWDEKYSVGDENIDNQHKRIFEIGSNFVSEGSKGTKDLLKQLGLYASVHFSDEEDHMKLTGFPELEEHILLHKELLEKLIAFIKKGVNSPDDAEEVKEFFSSWLSNHVMSQDMKYFTYSQNRNK